MAINQKCVLFIAGKDGKTYCFRVKQDPSLLAEQQAAGIEIFESGGHVPMWVAQLGLIGPWCAAQRFCEFVRLW